MREPDHTKLRSSRKGWIAAAVVVAAVLFWMATSDEVYDLTSPPALSWHVLLRKAYSIAAFALVGFMFDKALGASARPIARGALLVGTYSAAIEIVQAFMGSTEGLGWNAIDTMCGAVGGSLGVIAARIIRSRRRA